MTYWRPEKKIILVNNCPLSEELNEMNEKIYNKKNNNNNDTQLVTTHCKSINLDK